MTVHIRIEWGFQLENELFFGYTYTHNGLINLASELWDEMRYHTAQQTIIDYPGEYDVKNRSIKALLGKNQKLNYLIQWKNKKFWIIQSADILENEEVSNMDTWLYLWENVRKKLEQLEMEGEYIDLETYGKSENEHEETTA